MKISQKIINRRLVGIIFLMGIMFLMGVNFTSAALDITQTIADKSTDNFNYGKITLRDWFGLGDEIWIGEIKGHTESCFSNCESIIELNVKEGLPYYDSIRFYKINNGQRTEKNIYNYKIEKRTKHTPVEYPIYNSICSPTGKLNLNGTAEQSCEDILTRTEIRYEDEWEEITPETKSDGLTAYIRIIGNKKPSDIIDWVITTNGEVLDSWAVWGAGLYFINDNFNTMNATTWDFKPSTWQQETGYIYANTTVIDQYIYSNNNFTVNYSINGRTSGLLFNISLGTEYSIIFSSADSNLLAEGNGFLFQSNGYIYYLRNASGTYTMGGGTYLSNVWTKWEMVISETTLNIYKNDVLVHSNVTIPNIKKEGIVKINGFRDNINISDVEYYSKVGEIFLNSPADKLSSVNQTILFNCSATPTSPATLVNISLWTNNTGWKLNDTVAVTGATGSVTFMKKFPVGNYNWSCSACDSDGDCGKSSTNRTFEVTNIQENSKTYSATAYETATERFELNISTTSKVISVSGNLIYNGTTYASTVTNTGGTNYSLINYLNIPLASVSTDTKNLYWVIDYYDGTTSSSKTITPVTQSIKMIDFNLCNSSLNGVYINFTAKNESNLGEVKPFTFDGTFSYWLGGGSAYKNRSITGSLFNNTALCFSASERTLYLDANIEYGDGGVQYITKDYLLSNASYTNITTNHTLYMLDADDSTTFILKVEDSTQVAQPDIYIHIQRYYPGTDTYETVQIAKTGDDGKTVGFYTAETVTYRHRLYDEGGTLLLQTTPSKVFPESTPYTITFTIGSDLEVPWYALQDLGDLTSDIAYNNLTKKANFSYIDTSGSFTSARFYVEKAWANQSNQVICNDTSTLAAALMECNIGTRNGTFIAKGYITRGTTETLVELYVFDTSTARNIFDKTGLFLAFFIILVAGMVFIYNFIAGIVSVNAAVIFVNLIGLAHFSAIFVFGMIALSLFMIVLLRQDGGGGGY